MAAAKSGEASKSAAEQIDRAGKDAKKLENMLLKEQVDF